MIGVADCGKGGIIPRNQRRNGREGGHALTTDRPEAFCVMESIDNKPCRKKTYPCHCILHSVFDGESPGIRFLEFHHCSRGAIGLSLGL